MKRLKIIDEIKGLLLVGMLLYHAALFYFICIGSAREIYSDLSWIIFQKSIAYSFLFLVGFNLAYSNDEKLSYIEFIKKQKILFLSSVIVSIVSFFTHGAEKTIYFGILHSILVGKLFAWFLLKFRYFNLLVALCLFYFSRYEFSNIYDIFYWTGLGAKKVADFDFQPLFPNHAFIYLGIFVSKTIKCEISNEVVNESFITKILISLGKQSLFFYMAHVPIIAGFVYIICHVL